MLNLYTSVLVNLLPHMKIRNILPIFAILFVTTLSVANTYAYFTAQRTASTNTFATGTLDLDISSGDSVNASLVVENLGISSNIQGNKSWTVKNSGSLPGRLLIKMQNVLNKENGCNDQEKFAEESCETDDIGELGNVVDMRFIVAGSEAISSKINALEVEKFTEKWNALSPIILQAGETKNIDVYWEAKGENYGNEIQSDSLNFDLNFGLVQVTN